MVWGDQDNYEVIRKLGRGKYSEVFEIHNQNYLLNTQTGDLWWIDGEKETKRPFHEYFKSSSEEYFERIIERK